MTTTAPSTTTERNSLTLILSLAIAGLALVAFVIGLFTNGASGLASSMLIVGMLALVPLLKPGALTAWILVAFDAAFLLATIGSWITFTDLPGFASYWAAFVLLLLQTGAAVVLALVEVGMIKTTPKAPAAFGGYGSGGAGGGYGGASSTGYGQQQPGQYGQQPSPGYAAPSTPGYGQPAAGSGYGQPPAPGYGGQPSGASQQPGQHPQPTQQQPTQQQPTQQPGGGYSQPTQYGQHGSQPTPPPQPGQQQPGQPGAPTSQPWQAPNS